MEIYISIDSRNGTIWVSLGSSPWRQWKALDWGVARQVCYRYRITIRIGGRNVCNWKACVTIMALARIGTRKEGEASHMKIFCGCLKVARPFNTETEDGISYEKRVCWEIEWLKLFYKMNVHVQFLILKFRSLSIVSGVTCYETRQVARIVLFNLSCAVGSIITKMAIKRKGISISFDK